MNDRPITLRALAQPQPISVDVLREKYAKGEERDAEQVMRRVARGLASVEPPDRREASARRFLAAMRDDGFIPAGRIMSAAGTDIGATLINCFVQPVGDSIRGADDNGWPGIYDALAEAAETMRRGGGVGYDFSAIRPKGARVRGTHSSASGPVSYMHVFDKSCETVESAGSRRGAQMGVLRCDHPDIEEFVHAKDGGALSNFNLSVGVTDAFMHAVIADADWPLVHEREPGDALKAAGAFRRDDGRWVWRVVRASVLWRDIVASTYDHAEPGVLFLDTIDRDNNLAYCERILSTNPCSEQPLPAYGCCCLGSINLTVHVREPFTPQASFDFESFAGAVAVAVRMLDDVLDLSYWPLPQQQAEARAKRRIGVGFTGLGNALTMLGLRYDQPEARAMAARIARALRDAAYDASVALAIERGPFPMFDAERFLCSGFASRLPAALRERVRLHGLRNSHLLSIAPTGTISLAFADNASNGIEPAFAHSYTRRKRMPDGSRREYRVEDHAWRLWHAIRGRDADEERTSDALPPGFVTALEISASDHLQMVAAVAPFIDTAISKTVNVPADYPFGDFESLYLDAWRAGLKGLSTYRPNEILGAVLSTDPAAGAEAAKAAPAADRNASTEASVAAVASQVDADHRLVLESRDVALATLRSPGRPSLPAGADAWVSDMIEHPLGSFALIVSHETDPRTGARRPFEVWIAGNEAPRGLGAIAKTLSMDMRANDRLWLQRKLDAISQIHGDDAFEMPFPPSGRRQRMPSLIAAVGRVVAWRCRELGALPLPGDNAPTPLIDTLITRNEPVTTPDGTMSWTVDIANPATDDRFVLVMRELVFAGRRMPYSLALAGDYPRALDGLCRLLSLDMRVADAGWIGMKLRKLVGYAEPRGDFLAWVPGEARQQSWPSTVAYLARLVIHRYRTLGILDADGWPLPDSGSALGAPAAWTSGGDGTSAVSHGGATLGSGPMRCCDECGGAMFRRDGCDQCRDCGAIGACG